MPPNDSRNKVLWLVVESTIGALLLLCVTLLLDIRGDDKVQDDRLVQLERRMDADEADEFTSQDALEVWKAIHALAKDAADINPAVGREFEHMERRVRALEHAVGTP